MADTGKQGAFAVRMHVLRDLARELAPVQAPVLLVKGAALALTAYPKPWVRGMSDVDALLWPTSLPAVLEAARRAGWETEQLGPARRHTQEVFGEVSMLRHVGRLVVRLELHSHLDKLVERPVSLEALFQASLPLPHLPPLRYPCPEHHVVLLAIHAAGDAFEHRHAVPDIQALASHGLHWERVAATARDWQAATVTWMLLKLARQQAGVDVPQAVLNRLEPSRPRQQLMQAALGSLESPHRNWPGMGLPWIATQATMRDDPAHYAAGIARYAALRTLERAESWAARRNG